MEPLAALLPIRDRRDRTIGFELSTAPPIELDTMAAAHDNARASVALIPVFARLAARPLLVPVTPGLVRDGSLTRFASMDVVFLIAADALEDPLISRALERLLARGMRFAVDGFPEEVPLPTTMAGAIIVVDARRTSPAMLGERLRSLVDAGYRPLVRGVDDRAMRQRALGHGAMYHSGRLLTRSASTPVDSRLYDSVVRVITMLASFSDGRPVDAALDHAIEQDPHLRATLLKAVGSASIGVRNPRSVPHAVTMLGRDAVMEKMAFVGARLLGELADDPELALSAMRRVRLCERIGSSLDPAPHPRMRVIAGLLSVVEFALAIPPAALCEGLLSSLPPLLQDALIERRHPVGALLDLVDAIECGWWSDLRTRCNTLRLNPAIVSTSYQEAWRNARDELSSASRTDLS